MTPGHHLARWCALPELKFIKFKGTSRGWFELELHSESQFRACPKCQNLSYSVYDHRWVNILDSPLRDRRVRLKIRKKRYYCGSCKKPFTELLHGIYSYSRCTDRFDRSIRYFSSHFQNLVQVASHHGCSRTTIHRRLYPALERELKRHLNYSWPKQVGLDENRFGTAKGKYYSVDYNTMVVDITHDRVYRVCASKNVSRVFEELKNIPGAENVEDVVIDLSEGYRKLAKALFPNARITADKFHVLRLLLPAINRTRKQSIGDRRTHPMGRLLLRSKYHLPVSQRWMVYRFLESKPKLQILYQFKERLHGLYRTKGYHRASLALENILEDLKAYDDDLDLKRLRFTLTRWKNEILNYFLTGLTNAMTEGFNNKAKLVRKMAYGYKNRDNYKIRLLNACFG